MSTSASLSLRSKALQWAFAIYAVFSLISMATMSLGAGLLVFTILFVGAGSGLKLSELKQEIVYEWRGIFFKQYFWISLAFAVCCALSLIWAILDPVSFGDRSSPVHFFKDFAKIWYLFWPCLLVVGLRQLSEWQRLFVLKAWLGAFLVLSVIGIFQYFTGWPRPQIIPNETHYHATLFLGHHLSVASILIFPFFVALDWANSRIRAMGLAESSSGDAMSLKRLERERIFSILAVVLGGLTLFLTYSRTLWVALPIGLFAWCLFSLSKKMKWVACALLAVGGFVTVQIPSISERLHNGMGIGTRKDLWMANFDFFKLRPLFGVGWRHNQELSGYYLMEKLHSSDVFSGHAHNNFLDMLGGIGGFGALAWLSWCAFIFIILIRNRSSSLPFDFRKGLICAWIVFQINGLTQLNFWEAKVQHQMAWVIAWSLL